MHALSICVFLKFCCLPTIVFYSCNLLFKCRIVLLLTIEVLGISHLEISRSGECSHYSAVLKSSLTFLTPFCVLGVCIYLDHIFVILFLLPEEAHWLLAGYGRHVLNEAEIG